MASRIWNKFINETIPEKERQRQLRVILQRSMDGPALLCTDRHGAFNEPRQDSRGFASKVGK